MIIRRKIPINDTDVMKKLVQKQQRDNATKLAGIVLNTMDRRLMDLVIM